MGLIAAAAAWGFAEATLFFVVPDVLLSAIAIRDLRRAFLCCLVAALAAVIGGLIMYEWGAVDPAVAVDTVESLPGIGSHMIERVRAELASQGILAMILGPLSGTPYKVYAVQAAKAGVDEGLFILMSLPARLPRFLLVSLAAALASRFLQSRGFGRWTYPIWFVAWTGFYALYFALIE